jgi:hypothetical protein
MEGARAENVKNVKIVKIVKSATRWFPRSRHEIPVHLTWWWVK